MAHITDLWRRRVADDHKASIDRQRERVRLAKKAAEQTAQMARIAAQAAANVAAATDGKINEPSFTITPNATEEAAATAAREALEEPVHEHIFGDTRDVLTEMGLCIDALKALNIVSGSWV
jgi:hypothetical protein